MSQVSRRDGQNGATGLSITAKCTLFARLAPSDFSLFPNLKKFLAGKRYRSDAEVIAATNAYFEELNESSYRDGIKALEHRWEKCIEFQGDYVEK